MNGPEISVIMPVGDAEVFVERALRQLEAQTFTDFEVVIVTDAPTDSTVGLLESYRGSLRLRVAHLPRREGVARARNVALTRATGRYVWFADVDDLWRPTLLEVLHGAITADDADLSVCRADEALVGHEGETSPLPGVPGSMTADRAFLVRQVLDGLVTGHLWDKLFRRDVLPADLFPALRSKSDLAGFLAIVPTLHRVAFVDSTQYTYLVRSGSITTGSTVTPRDLLACGEPLQRLRDIPLDADLAARLSAFHVVLRLKALAEVWRYPGRVPAASAIEADIRSALRWSDLPMVLQKRGLQPAILAALVMLAPGVPKTVFTAVRARRIRAMNA